MKGNVIRWLLAALLLLFMATLLCSPAVGEIQPLGEAMSEHGYPPRKDSWLSENEYQDESIHIQVYSKMWKAKSASEMTTCRWIIIEITDPSQIRTAMSKDSYDAPDCASVIAMSRSVNAVVAMNGDFFKNDYGKGYVVRQGVAYRDLLNGDSDCLIIDDRGDLTGVHHATSESMAEATATLEAEGKKVINAFTFGPILIENGVACDVSNLSDHADVCATQRIALVQLDELKYAIVEVDADGGYGTGMNIAELQRFIVELFPDCKIAYNFDGGGSTHLVVNSRAIHSTPSGRNVSDIIYFASIRLPEDQ